ncbi:MAG: phosphate acyltransferase PlsX [Christensenellaceae bacterium]|jgi:glycerol-3-phosphate acyltransferase PlsX|nr:phosphate acyltransferase PlsX [Christensenellaceae bacterium]
MKILVDAFGGDNAPHEIINGSIEALCFDDKIKLALLGDENIIKDELKKYSYDHTRIEVIHAPLIISNDESPTDAVRKKKDSSIVKGLTLLGSDPQYNAFVSAGSTGAVLVSSFLILKCIKGIRKPALVPVLPTMNDGNVLLIDCGANVDCRAKNLVDFAYMGAAYSSSVLNVKNPRIGLLSNGAEDEKGNVLNKEVFPLLKATNLNFVGNVEARDILSGRFDVIVADGFSGNIALKSSEGVAIMLLDLIKKNILSGGLRAKIGYLFLKPVFKKIAKTMDYNNNGGAILLGLNKPVVKAHGSSKAKSIRASIIQANSIAESALIQNISDSILNAMKEPNTEGYE